ncbi:hypothetical protein MG296_14510 [Flavobacteriaceae bacterium TK19130]|nr:hypothetical protein [Thermobacterium salinum]
MKHTLIVLLIFTGVNLHSQNKLIDATCECLNQITEQSNQSTIAKEAQNCFQSSYKNYNSEIGLILKSYVSENPDVDMDYAEKNVPKILTEKLYEQCAKFREIDDKLSRQQQNSSDVISTVAAEICEELQIKDKLSDEIVDPILIQVTKKHQVTIYGKYNLDIKEEMRNYTSDLNTELIKICPTYKTFVVEKNKI